MINQRRAADDVFDAIVRGLASVGNSLGDYENAGMGPLPPPPIGPGRQVRSPTYVPPDPVSRALAAQSGSQRQAASLVEQERRSILFGLGLSRGIGIATCAELRHALFILGDDTSGRIERIGRASDLSYEAQYQIKLSLIHEVNARCGGLRERQAREDWKINHPGFRARLPVVPGAP